MEIDYKQKIKKLLALAKSPNENEAKAALLKARKLMAQHKLSQNEIETDDTRQKAVRLSSGITCSKRRDPWIIALSDTIGQHFCCQAVLKQQAYRSQTYSVDFYGLEDDVDVCLEVFRYAVLCAKLGIVKVQSNACGDAAYRRRLGASYGYGFFVGVYTALQEQQKEYQDAWGLVMATPKDVADFAASLNQKSFKGKLADQITAREYEQGFEDGKVFQQKKKYLKGKGESCTTSVC